MSTDHAHEFVRDGGPTSYRCQVPGCGERVPSIDKLAAFLVEQMGPEVDTADIADVLRSPAGIDALTGDETIREGISRGTNELIATLQRDCYEMGRRETALKIADAIEKAYNPNLAVSHAVAYAAYIARSFTEESSET